MLQPDRVSVLISSFDGYSACWPAVAHGIERYWPDCPYPIYLLANEQDFDHPVLSVLKVGEDLGWSRSVLAALARLRTPYLIYMQEDYWLTRLVDTSLLEEYVDQMELSGLNYIRLRAAPEPDRDYPGDARLGILADDASYRTSAQISLWRRDVLQDLIVPGESPWEFEINGTIRSRQYGDTFLSVKSKDGDESRWGIDYLCTAIVKGKWIRGAKRYAEDEGVAIDFSALPEETWWDDFKRFGGLGAFADRWAYRLKLLLMEPSTFFGRLSARLLRSR